jgi:hypothetical protein
MNLTEREWRVLRDSWAEGFAKTVFPAINEERFSELYSEDPASRPNSPVNVTIGAFLIMEMFDLTDDEMIEQLMFNVQYQYALHTTSFKEQPLSDRTFSRFRERAYRYAMENDGRDLIEEEMKALAGVYAAILQMGTGTRRMDSMMVSTNARRLSRLSLMFLTLRSVVEMIKKDAGAELPEEFRQYQKDSEHQEIGYKLKKTEVIAKMEEVLRDALRLAEYCESRYPQADEYRRLMRMIEDQSKVAPSGARVLKENEEILPTSMQTPYDEDATYRKKGNAGHVGYVLNLDEACSEGGNMVLNYDLQQNNYSDAQFAKDTLSALPEENGIETIITDGAYGSAETLEMAEAKGIKLAATTLIGGAGDGFEAGFEIGGVNEIKRCPAGHEPLGSKYNEKSGTYSAHFDSATCESCQYCERCPGEFQKKAAKIQFTEAARTRAEFTSKMETDEYKGYARLRNGVEGVPSVLRRRYGIDHIPVTGLVRVKMWIGFKIGAMNTVRFLKATANGAVRTIASCGQELLSSGFDNGGLGKFFLSKSAA